MGEVHDADGKNRAGDMGPVGWERTARLRPSPAMVVALAALFVSLGGAAYAGVTAKSVGTKHLQRGAVTPPKIAGKAVKTPKIAGQAVKTGKLANEAVTENKLATWAVTGVKVRNDTLTGPDVLDGSLSGADILNGSIGLADLGGNSVSSSRVVNNSLTGSDINESTLNLSLTAEFLESNSNSNSPKEVFATCPSGTQAISGGAYIIGGTGGAAPDQRSEVVISRLLKITERQIWVIAHETDSIATNWSVVAQANCARIAG